MYNADNEKKFRLFINGSSALNAISTHIISKASLKIEPQPNPLCLVDHALLLITNRYIVLIKIDSYETKFDAISFL